MLPAHTKWLCDDVPVTQASTDQRSVLVNECRVWCVLNYHSLVQCTVDN